MTVRKITISMDAVLLGEVERLAKKAHVSRSQWLTLAARSSVRRKKLREAVDLALEETGGPLSDAERAQARRDLGIGGVDAEQ